MTKYESLEEQRQRIMAQIHKAYEKPPKPKKHDDEIPTDEIVVLQDGTRLLIRHGVGGYRVEKVLGE